VNQEDKLQHAAEIFGMRVVRYVVEVVELSDADGAVVLFEDEGMQEHAECVRLLYFND
jgi:hypothetical protein